MSNASALMDLLFPPTRQRVLAVLLLQPDAGFHLRELARISGTHAGTLARELDKLTQTGLLLRAEQGNQVRYQANAKHPLFEEVASLFRKTHGIVPALRQALAAKAGNPVQYEAMASFGASSDEVDSKLVINPARNYRDMPLIVLTSTMDPPPPPGVTLPPMTEAQKAQKAAMDAVWNRGHDELAALSTRGVNARVPRADHYIQRAKPQVVLDAVAQVVSEARAGGAGKA